MDLHQKGLNYYHGANDTRPNKSKAFLIFQRLASEGHTQSILELACMYFLGEGPEGSPQFVKAVELWERLGNRNHDALYGIGLCNHVGSGEFPKDHEKAKKYLEKSAQLGNIKAKRVLDKYYSGKNLQRDGNEKLESLWKDGGIVDRIGAMASNPDEKLYAIMEMIQRFGFLNNDRSKIEKMKAEMTEVQKSVSQMMHEVKKVRKDLKSSNQPGKSQPVSKVEKNVPPEIEKDVKILKTETENICDIVQDMKATQFTLKEEIMTNRQMIMDLKDSFEDSQKKNFNLLNEILSHVQKLQEKQNIREPNEIKAPKRSLPAIERTTIEKEDKSEHSKKIPKKSKGLLPSIDQNRKPSKTSKSKSQSVDAFQFDNRPQIQLTPIETLKKRMFSSIEVNKELRMAKRKAKKKKHKPSEKDLHEM